MRAAVVALIVAALVSSAAADGARYELRIPDSVEVEPAVSSTVSLTIAGTGSRTISKDGPIHVELSSPTLTLPRTRYERRHAADPAAETPRFDLKFTAPAAGDHELVLALRFWVCGAKVCRPVRATKTVTVKAAAPTPPPDAGPPDPKSRAPFGPIPDADPKSRAPFGRMPDADPKR